MPYQIETNRIQISIDPQQLVRRVRSKAAERLAAAAEDFRDRVIDNISTRTAQAGPSKPGEFPHQDAGELIRSIFARQVGELEYEVGADAPHALYLEYSMDRSFLRRTLHESLPWLQRVLK